ncbi:hypothetical protein [Trinickia fusca]|uniref:hypothetical protein n=1 Tax=Trinickia fusca TaxID=2419777 RepID=UPI0011C43272|nr:hypothetical protein [Trinickia fusca]
MTLLTLMYRDEVDESTLSRGYAAVRDLLAVSGGAPVAFVDRLENGARFLRVLCNGRVPWRRVRDGWCSVLPGSASVDKIRSAAVLDVLAGCESILR